MFLNVVFSIAGMALIGVGLLVLPTPVPVGALLIISGFALLVPASNRVRRLIHYYRLKNPRVEPLIARFRPMLPPFLRKSVDVTTPRRLLRRTNPG